MFYLPDFDQAVLSESESHHCIKVLRSKPGDRIRVVNGKGFQADATIIEIGKKGEVRLNLHLPWDQKEKPKEEIWICVAPTKNADRMEWLVEKATEVGVDGLIFLITARTERSHLKLERLEKVALSALKQSKGFWLPRLEFKSGFDELVWSDYAQLLVADLRLSQQLDWQPIPGKNLIFIGPEGDFTQNELELMAEKGAKGIRLAENILRTETAAFYALCQAHMKIMSVA